MPTYHLSIKSGKKGKAANHAAYITRQGRHGKNDKGNDLVVTGHGNLPDWAEDRPTAFWSAADENERANGAAYREFEVALPKELSLQENEALLKSFIEAELGMRPYQFAIHAPVAALGGVAQPHGHVMFSDRIPDEVERSPGQFFRRFNPVMPEAGGCKKASGGKSPLEMKQQITQIRENWATLQNECLAAHGVQGRVDHRSFVARGIDENPERHLGHLGIKKMDEQARDEFLSARALRGA